ncbi:MAG: type II and III secretion system protein family protein [Alphaproteobacteria bacterium]|nr:MAG: type II and III secretion system protein family protein [Alphaproteobacteria bacterium]
MSRLCVSRIFLCLFLFLLIPTGSPQAQIVAADNQYLTIDLDGGALIRLKKQASAVFVSNPEIADVQVKSPTLVYVFGKAAGETTLFAVDNNEQILFSRKIAVNYSLTRLKESIKTIAPNSRVDVSAMDGGIVLKGQVNTAVEAENIRQLAGKFVGSDDAVINSMEVVGANQVNLRVRIAEVSKDVLKNIGFNWDYLLNPKASGEFLFGLATGSRVPYNGSGFNTRYVDPDTFLTNNSLMGRYDGSNYDISGVVDLLEGEGLINILAEPNLTSLSGETASFLVGGEFPIPIRLQDNAVDIEFKPYGIGLAFTPTVVGGNRISMRIRPEVSQLSNQGAVRLSDITLPAITTRRAETTVEVGSGQSFAIAGLLQNNTQEDINKYPGLGDLPILGMLFKSERFRRRETELVIIATPYLVQPSNNKLLIPQTGLRSPTEPERVLLGKRAVAVEDPDTSPTPNIPTAGFITE